MARVEDKLGSLERLGIYFNNKKFSDVVVETEDGTRFHCHKIVLAAGSPVFETMFDSHGDADLLSFKEAKEQKVVIKELNTAAVNWVLSAMYSGEGELTKALVVPIMMAASMYQVEWVYNACRLFLTENLNENASCVILNKLVETQGVNRALRAQFAKFIHDNIVSISDMESFLELSDEAIELLATLHTTFDFCKGLMRWLQHDLRARKETAVSLLSDMDFFSLEVEELEEFAELGAFNHLEGIEENIKHVLRVLKKQCASGKSWLFSYSCTFHDCKKWRAPRSGWYHIVAVGAKAADLASGAYRGGRGAILGASFQLQAGQLLKVLTGGMSTDLASTTYSGGGGGTFVFKEDGGLLIAAGGGGGCSSHYGVHGIDGNMGEHGYASPNGGAQGGTNGNRAPRGGRGWLDGVAALATPIGSNNSGGFGGGGNLGGGGGYSGGGENPVTGVSGGGGGGGGSYIAPGSLNQWKKVGGKGHGCVSIWCCENKPTSDSFKNWLEGCSQ